MDQNIAQIVAGLRTAFPDVAFSPQPLIDRSEDDAGAEQVFVRVPPDKIVEVMRFLHDDARCDFQQLASLTCVDYLDFPKARDRYAVVYTLVSPRLNHRMWVKCFVNDPDPAVPSVTGIWNAAEWTEREVFDLFGIRFSDHPDLRRIMTWDGFKAHPLRKDYPLRGHGEREDFTVVTDDSR